MTTPLIRTIAHTFPNARLDVLVIPQTQSILRHNPHVDNVLLFDKRSKVKKPVTFLKTLSLLKKEKYDAAISTNRSMTNSLLMKWAGISTRVGFSKQKMLTHPVNHPKGMHMRERYSWLARPFFDGEFDVQTELFWAKEEEKQSIEILETIPFKNRPIIGMAPGSVWKTKMWPKEYFTKLVSQLVDKNFNIMLFGGPDEHELCEKVNKTGIAVNLAGKLSLTGSAALIKKCDLMITNDSAPLHMANAVQTDVFAFFGPTVKRFGCYPYRKNDKMLEIENLACRPCSRHGGHTCPQKHFKCMKETTPEMVLNEIENYFGGKNA